MSKNRKPLVPKKDEWDPNEWQGRSKKQVDSDNAVGAFAVIALLLTLIGSILYEAVTRWLN